MADAAQRAAEISMEQYMDGLVDFNTSVSTLRMLASQQDQRASIQGPATANLYFCSQRHTKQQVEIPMLAQLYGRVFFIAFLLTLFCSRFSSRVFHPRVVGNSSPPRLPRL
jgi:hypothetical protein